MTCQWMSRSRTLAASSTHRLVSHAQGHSGSNQKSTRAVTGALCTASVICGAPQEVGRRPPYLLSLSTSSRPSPGIPVRRGLTRTQGSPRRAGRRGLPWTVGSAAAGLQLRGPDDEVERADVDVAPVVGQLDPGDAGPPAPARGGTGPELVPVGQLPGVPLVAARGQ